MKKASLSQGLGKFILNPWETLSILLCFLEMLVNIVRIGISLISNASLSNSERKESYIRLRADSCLISLSIIIFVAAMVLEGFLFLPIIGSSLKVQVETFTAYIFTTSMVMLAIVGVSSFFKRKF